MSAVPIGGMERKARARRRTKARNAILDRTVSFCLIVALSYLSSSLAGQVMVEKARLEGIRAHDRAVAASKVVGEIENRLNEMTNLNSIDEWARAHNFLSIEELSQPATAVAAATASRAPKQPLPALTSDRSGANGSPR